MAGTVKITFIGDATKLKNTLGQVKKDLDDSGSNFTKFNDKVKSAGQQMMRTGAALTAGLTLPIVLFGKKSVEAFSEAQEAAVKLETNLLNVKGNTLANVKAIDKLAASLQKKGVIDGDVIKAGAAQLATFNLQGKTIEKVTPKIADMVAQLKGYNATNEDAVKINNLVGKVLTGNVGALSRYGVTLSEAQKKQLKLGNETERAALLVEILGQNFGKVNENLAKTPKGKITQLKMEFEDLQEEVGQLLVKYITPLATKLIGFLKTAKEKFDDLSDPQKKAVAAAVLFAAALGPLVLVLGSVATALGAIAANPVVLTIAGIALAVGALTAGLIALYKKSESFKTFVNDSWTQMQEIIEEAWNGHIKPALEGMKAEFDNLKRTVEELFEKHPELKEFLKMQAITVGIALLVGLQASLKGIELAITGVSNAMTALRVVLGVVDWVVTKFEQFLGILKSIWDFIAKIGNGIGGLGKGVGDKVSGAWNSIYTSGRALGGSVQAGMPYKVGEGGGSEVFIPNTDGTIVNARQTRGMGSTYNVTMNVSKTDMTQRDLISALKRFESLHAA